MDTVHKQEYKVRDLTTRSVTLFPSRAQVVRELKDVSFKPGVNEITVIGLTPTVDEHSIKVEGTGLAVISNITVELQSNRDIYEDIYPDSDNDSDETSDEEQILDPNATQEDAGELKQVRQQLVALRDEQTRAKESLASAENRLKILDAYGKHMAEEDGTDIVGSLDKYRSERKKVFHDHMAGVKESRDILLRIEDATKFEARLVAEAAKAQRKAVKAWLKAQKAKQTEQTKKDRRKAEQQKEKARIRTEREKFWPRQCYAVCITLDATSFTPMSSRRNSVSSDLVKVPVVGSDDAVDPSQLTCDLVLSYVTTAAFWSPSYDLQLSTTTNKATLCFDAQLTNKTSETWSNCKIVLSTSQASFSGIADAIPTLAPWRIKLAIRGTVRDNTALLASREELREKESWQAQRKQLPPQQSRNALFGRPQQNAWGASHGWGGQQQQLQQQQLQQQSQQSQQSTAAEVFGAPEEVLRKKAAKSANMMAVASSSFASNARSAFPPPPAPSAPVPGGGPALHASVATSGGLFGVGGGGFGSHASRGGGLFAARPDLADDETEVNVDVEPELDFEESAMEETGLTTTYDLSNSKTLAPRSTASKQRVVRLTLPDVVFSHTVVAKYRPVAYLKARLRNISKMTLLRGPTGLTLDGAFMGRTNLPRCSPGDSFSLSLGVDPAVKVLYPKPEVRRGTTGIFKVENSGVYTRAITLINTRSSTGGGKAIRLLVHDQIPVSEDERLKVEILQPKGLSVGGGGVGAGAPTRDGKEDRDWGTAVASLKKEGEVSWDVSLKAGRGVRLGLEYVVALPGGEHAVQCQDVGKTWTQMHE
ncbi:Protein F37C4.5 like protein [Verticillium longisporum]|uniref:Protein F37C4.5 like protein n=1 Tax=Verticillium longisporum TaxID=100787 RepID=A0A8I3AKF5_VERLO|nr:Protein F37C4.5 like protein [Verticillium longisporum]